MREIGVYLRDAGRWGISLMTGGLFSYVLSGIEHFRGKSVTSGVWVLAGTFLFIIGGFFAWHKEYVDRLAAERNVVKDCPKIVFSTNDSWSINVNPMYFEAKNIGGRTARDITLIAPKGNLYSCQFATIEMLLPMESKKIEILPGEDGQWSQPDFRFVKLLSYLTEQRTMMHEVDPLHLVFKVGFTDMNDLYYEDQVYLTATFSPHFIVLFTAQPHQ